MRTVRPRIAGCTVTAALVMVLSSACGGSDDLGRDPSAKDDMTPTEQLLARPTTEQANETYKDQLVRVRDALAKLAPDVEWEKQRPEVSGGSSCGEPYDRVDGNSSADFLVLGAGAIPDEDWDQAIAVTAKVLAADGYDKSSVTVNKPGQHSASFYGPYGTEITIAGQRSTTIQLLGGCFLGADEHSAATDK